MEKHILSAMRLSHTLIKIETEKMRKIPNLSSYKEAVIKALTDLFDYYGIEDKKEIFKLYELEEKKIKIENELFEPYIIKEDNYNYETINYAVNVFNEVIDLVAKKIYYVCFYSEKANDKFPGYSLEDNFWKIAFDFAEELDLPKNNLLDLHNELTNEERNYENKVRVLERLPAFSWFEKRKSLLGKYEWDNSNNKNNVISYLETLSKKESLKENNAEKSSIEDMDIFKELRLERDTEEHKTAVDNQRRNQGIVNIIRNYGILNNDETFNSLNYIGVKKLLNSDGHHLGFGKKEAFFKEDISKNISNDNLLLFLKFFEEIGIKGSVEQTGIKYKKAGSPQCYMDKDGEKTYESMEWGYTHFNNATLEVGLKSGWDLKYNEILEKLLISFNYDLSLLKYKDNRPIIKL